MSQVIPTHTYTQRLDTMNHVTLNNMGYTRMKVETYIYFTLPPSPLELLVIVTVSDDFAIVV